MPDFSHPFKPKQNNLPLTEPEEIGLNTEERAKKRSEFDKHMLLKLVEREHQRKKEDELKRLKDK